MSAAPFPVVFLNHVEWHGLRHRSHQLAAGMAARGHPLLYVEMPLSYGTAARRRRERLRTPWWGEERPAPGLTVLRPPLIAPWSNRSRAARRVNAALVGRGLAARSAAAGFQGAAVVCMAPSAVRVLDRLRPGAVAFDLADDYAAWPGQSAPARGLAAREMQALVRRADVCLAVSRHLVERYEGEAHRILHLPNGVEADLFAEASRRSPAQEVTPLPRPVIGFAGVVHGFFEQGWMRALAEHHPEYSVVVVGPAEVDVSALRGLPNLHLFGRQPYERLPSFVAGFDVAVLPWGRSGAALGANPAKIWQYAAAGKPVVATRLPEVEAAGTDAVLVVDQEGFVAAVERTLSTAGDLRAAAARAERAAAEDWSTRVDVLERVLEEALSGPGAAGAAAAAAGAGPVRGATL